MLFRPARRSNQSSPGERVDHRDTSPYVIVSEGDLLARVVPERRGKMGENVFGETLAYSTRKVRSPRPGKNVRRDGDLFHAAVDGRLVFDAGGFAVNPVLELRESVDYHTGHIDFPGDVILHQEVRDGFRIRAEGSVFCMRTLDATDVNCGGDLIAKQGIIGCNRALIKVGGKVQAKYLENCHVEAVGDVLAEAGIVNSHVNSLGRIRTGPRGVIVGGSARAVHGIVAAQLGTATGPRTLLHCGTDFSAEEKLKWIQEKLLEIGMKRQQLENRPRATASDEELAALSSRLTEAQTRLQDATIGLMDRLDPNDEASIEVSGVVHSSTYVEICHVSLKIDHERRAVRFVLDKRSGSVETAPLKKRG